jgi:phage-related tail fiber protein
MALTLDGTNGISASGGVNVLQDDSVVTGNLVDGGVTVPKIGATGTASSSTFLRGDGAWAVVEGTPAGTVITVAMNTAPTGYLKANGAAVSRSTYAALFAVIGTTFGAGDGSTTFALPDLRGEFIRGWDDGRGVDSGRAFGSAQSQAIQSHFHWIQRVDTGTANFAISGGTNGTENTGQEPRRTGSTGGAETRPRNVALLACIKF